MMIIRSLTRLFSLKAWGRPQGRLVSSDNLAFQAGCLGLATLIYLPNLAWAADAKMTAESLFGSASLPSLFDADAQDSWSVPDLGRDGVSFADQYQNRLIGQWSLQRLNASAMTLSDPWVQRMISELTWRLNAQVRQQAPLAVVIINDPTINAFAIPGGVIGLNTGTITAASSLDEVAGVLAHEVAHLSQRHYEHGDEARRKALWVQIGGLLAAIAASSADGDAAAAIMMGSQTIALDSQMAFSRDNEREADRVGMQIMAQAGFDSQAMPRFFATLNARSRLNRSSDQTLPSFMRSHPLTDQRLSEAQSRAQRYRSVNIAGQQHSQRQFDLLKWRVQQLTNQLSERDLILAAKSSDGAALALISWYAKRQRFAKANAVLAKILERPQAIQATLEPLLSITRSELASEQDNWHSAVALLQRQQRLYPERRDLRLYLAQALIRIGEAHRAQTLLKPLTQAQKSDIQAWEGLQHANDYLAKHSSDPDIAHIATINALRYRSQIELWQAYYDKALISLTQALTLAKNAQRPSLVAMINHELQQVQNAKAFKPS